VSIVAEELKNNNRDEHLDLYNIERPN